MLATDLSPAAEIAPELKMSRERVVRAIQAGRLIGRRDPERGWLVSRASAQELARELKPSTAQQAGRS